MKSAASAKFSVFKCRTQQGTSAFTKSGPAPCASNHFYTPQHRAARQLSTPFHKYDHVCGEGFSAQTRRERRAYPFPTRRDKARATTSGPKRTAARRVASLFGSGVVAPRSSRQVGTGDAPSSRLARTEKRRNKRGRIYEMEY